MKPGPKPKSSSSTKYGKTTGEDVRKEMKKFNAGTAKSGKAQTPVKSREQAIAIGLSKAREEGKKVPKKK